MSRIKVKSLTIHGFKSFLSRIEIPFSDDITLCIGPNGCGKTNVFEALRFVLGENKQHKLRVKNWGELVFAGTREKRASPFAEVTMEIEINGTKKTFLRRVYRDSSQEFFIDQEKVSAQKYHKEINNIFGKKSYSHFQWEDVEELIRKPKERIKDMILEACELSDYEHKKNLIKRRIEKTEKELEAYKIVIMDKEQRLKELEREKKLAEKYKNLQQILKEKKELLLRAEYTKNIKDIERKEKEINELKKTFNFLEEESFKIREELKQILDTKNKIEQELNNLNRAKNSLIKDKEDILTSLNRALGEKNVLNERRKNLVPLIEELSKKIEEMEEEIHFISEKIDEEPERILKEKEQELKELKAKTEELLKRETKATVKFEEINLRKKELKEKAEVLTEKIEKLLKEKDKIDKRKEEIFREEKKNQEEYLETEKKLKKLKEEYENLSQEFKIIMQKTEALEGEKIRLKRAREIDEDMLKEYPFLSDIISFEEGEYIYLVEDVIDAKILDSIENIPSEFYEFLEKGGKIVLKRESSEEGVFKNFGNLLAPRFKKIGIVSSIEEGIKLWRKGVYDNIITHEGYIITYDGVLRKIIKEKIELNKRLREIEKELKISKEKIETLNISLQEKERELQILKEKEENLEKKLKEIMKHRIEIERDWDKIEFNIKRAEEEIKQRERELINLEKEEKILEKEIETTVSSKKILEEKIREKEKELEEIRKKVEAIREKRRKIESFSIYKDSLFQRRKELKEVEENIELLSEKIEELEEKRNSMEQKLSIIEEKERDLYNKLKEIEDKLENLKDLERKKEFEKQRIEDKIVNLKSGIEKVKEEMGFFPSEVVPLEKHVSPRKLREEIEFLEKELYSFKDVNLLAEEEYKSVERDYYNKKKVLEDIKNSIDNLKRSLEIMEEEARSRYKSFLEEFKENLNYISKLLMEGEIKIEPEDPKNILESPLKISVSPFGKKVRSVLLLSGGERSLFALCVLFTLASISPSPLFALDEVDAALDDANILRFRNFIINLSKSSQIFIITHNKRTMEIGRNIFGITMEDGISLIYGIKL